MSEKDELEKVLVDASELAEEAKKPGTFSIVDVLKERAYPKEEINIYLDEQSAYEASLLEEKIKELKKADAEEDKIEKLVSARDKIIKNFEKSKYVFSITGISEGLRDDIQEQSLEKFPMKYDEEKNPFTGEITKREVEDKERDRYFTNLIWHESITKIVDPSGSVQEKVTLEDVENLREFLPLASIGAITQSIEKLRMSTAMFMISVDEDFLAKS
jgi:hypothetical protein